MTFLKSILLSLALFSSYALPCASCGSGGDDPLILYPNEKWKLYLGESRTFNYKNISSKGEYVTAGGVTSKDQLTFSSGVSFSERAFSTIAVPMILNHVEQGSRFAFGDPSLAARYTFVLPSIADPVFLPQVQLIAGYKQAISRSIRETLAPKTLVDVFGTGFSEAKLGVDVWYGLYDFKLGMAWTLVQPFSRTFGDGSYSPSLGNRLTFTLGYQWNYSLRTTAGINRDYKGTLSKDGETLAESDQLNYGFFMTQDLLAWDGYTFRLSYARQAALLTNRNTSQIDSLSLACMKAF